MPGPRPPVWRIPPPWFDLGSNLGACCWATVSSAAGAFASSFLLGGRAMAACFLASLVFFRAAAFALLIMVPFYLFDFPVLHHETSLYNKIGFVFK